MIKSLINPKTQLYLDLKNFVFTRDFPWYYHNQSVDEKIDLNFFNVPFYSHSFLKKPETTKNKIPETNSNYTEIASEIFLQIFEYNNIKINYFIRINANCIHPHEKVLKTVPHVDHDFDHNNCLIYLTSSGGSTIVENSEKKIEVYDPKEDDVIVFGGERHYLETPKKERRIVFVATFV